MLTHKLQVFIDEYFKCWNGAEAARKAGYSERSIYSIASENLRKPEVQAEIKRRLEATAMSADEVLERLAQHARGSLALFLNGDGETIDLTGPEAQANLHLVKKFKVKKRMGGRSEDRWEEVETEIELQDQQGALEKLGRYHKLFTDKTEVSGDPERPFHHVFDHSRALAAVAPGPVGDREPSGAHQSGDDGAAVG